MSEMSDGVQEVFQKFLEFMPHRPAAARLKLFRYYQDYSGDPEDDVSTKTRSDFSRLWDKRDAYLQDDEVDTITESLRTDPSPRNVRLWTDWMACAYVARTGERL